MTACPYLTCRGQFGHPGPHLFEQPDIERLKAEAAAAERERLERALRLRLAAEPTPTRQIGLRDAIAILAEPTA